MNEQASGQKSEGAQPQELAAGESASVRGSGTRSYTLKNSGGIYSCSCPAWLHQSRPVAQRSCKHLRAYRGEQAERARLEAAGLDAEAAAARPVRASGGASGATGANRAPPLLLAHRWEGEDPAGWWVSEKLDGVRAYWDGTAFFSRQGNGYRAPSWFVAGLPDFPLDGELWVGRKQFQRTVSIVRRQDEGQAWQEVRYVVFDAPAVEAPFEQRLEAVDRCFGEREPPHAEVHPHHKCKGRDQLDAELQRVEALGGEGLMLRKPGSRYVAGRSATLLKVKRFKDAEGRVVKHLPGAGKHQGRLGSLLLELADGTRVSVGTGLSDAERENPPAIGAIVTFRYQELTDGGVPRFPSFVRERTDVDAPADRSAPSKESAPADKIAPAAKKPKGGEQGPTTRLVFSHGEEGKGKFWQVEQRGPALYVRFGALGKTGQVRLKSFDSDDEASAAAARLVADKQRKGYVPTDDG